MVRKGGWASKQFNYEPAARGILGHGSIPLGVIVFAGEWHENQLCGCTHKAGCQRDGKPAERRAGGGERRETKIALFSFHTGNYCDQKTA